MGTLPSISLDANPEEIADAFWKALKESGELNSSRLARGSETPGRTTLWRMRSGGSKTLIRVLALLQKAGYTHIVQDLSNEET